MNIFEEVSGTGGQSMKTLETYRQSLDAETWLLLSTDSKFLKFLRSSEKK